MRRRVFNVALIISSFVALVATVFWSRSNAGLCDMIEWSYGNGVGGLIESYDGRLDWYAPDNGTLERYFQANVSHLRDSPKIFASDFSVSLHFNEEHHLYFDLTIPWWWVVLTAIVIPAIRIRQLILSKRRKTQDRRAVASAYFAFAIVLVILLAVDFIPTTQSTEILVPRPPGYFGGWSVFGGADVTSRGWPFTMYSSFFWDGKKYGGWSFGAATSNLIVALLISLFVGSAIRSVTGIVWWFVRRRRTVLGLCRACSYNLTGNTSGVCPECGTSVELEFNTQCSSPPPAQGARLTASDKDSLA